MPVSLFPRHITQINPILQSNNINQNQIPCCWSARATLQCNVARLCVKAQTRPPALPCMLTALLQNLSKQKRWDLMEFDSLTQRSPLTHYWCEFWHFFHFNKPTHPALAAPLSFNICNSVPFQFRLIIVQLIYCNVVFF
jgi:hypothetical protein